MAEPILQLFKPDDIVIDFNGKKEKIVYDMDAVLELEKIYGSIDVVFKMLFAQATEEHVVKVKGEEVHINDVTVDGTPLIQHLQMEDAGTKSTIKDTLNLVWVGLLHNHTKRDEDGEIISCDITKAQVRTAVSFKKLAEINMQIVSALIRDLIAPDSEDKGEVKN